MPTLNINGTKVQVGDDFLKLSPEQQNATVEEIASHLGQGQAAGQGGAPQRGSPEFAAQFVQRQAAGQQQPQPDQAPPEWQPQDVMPAPLRAFSNHAVESVPVLGGLAHQAMASPMNDALAQSADAQAPIAGFAGDVFGSVAPFAAGGALPGVSRVLGMAPGMSMGSRIAASGLSTAGISGADTLSRGGNAGDIARDIARSGATGGALPVIGAGVGKGLNAIGNRLRPLFNTEHAAQQTVAGAAAADVRAGQALSRGDEASAALNGQPIVNADRFGGNVQTLARTAKNIAPTAGAALDDLTQQRFLTQSNRAVDFVKRITGGSVDDLGLQDRLTAAARASNKVAYDAAYAAPGAQAVWTPEIRQLFQSPDFLAAVRGASATGANDAAISGTKAVKNPFAFTADGRVGLRKAADGSTALPNLQFWDIVQRNLRAGSEKAFRAGDNLKGSQLSQLRSGLLNGLDSSVPQFARARAGAASAFGAEDAIDAGRKFVSQRMGIPEAQRAHAKFTPAEKKAFATGFASELIDKIGASRDGVNVINQVFGSPASRAQVELALGKNAATQLEHFVRIEDIMQLTKQAVQGNSSTVKQLIASGIVGGGVGGALSGWDPKTMASGAVLLTAGRAGARALGNKVDQKVMVRVAQILASGDPAEINRQVLNATISKEHAAAIRAIEKGLHEMGMAATVKETGSGVDPLYNPMARVTVRGAHPTQ